MLCPVRTPRSVPRSVDTGVRIAPDGSVLPARYFSWGGGASYPAYTSSVFDGVRNRAGVQNIAPLLPAGHYEMTVSAQIQAGNQFGGCFGKFDAGFCFDVGNYSSFLASIAVQPQSTLPVGPTSIDYTIPRQDTTDGTVYTQVLMGAVDIATDIVGTPFLWAFARFQGHPPDILPDGNAIADTMKVIFALRELR